MSAISSAPAPINQAMDMLSLLADPKRAKDVIAQFQKAQQDSENARRAAEETINALLVKQEDLANRERNITNREANVDKWEASLNQAQCDWNAKQLKEEEAFKVKVMTFEASKSEQISQLEAREATVASETARLAALDTELQNGMKAVGEREDAVAAREASNKADREMIDGFIKTITPVLKSWGKA